MQRQKAKIKKIQDINSGSKKFPQNRSSLKNNRGGGTETETERGREREDGWTWQSDKFLE